MSDVKFTVAQPYPEDNGAVTTPAGGTWSANTFSFKVSVVYDADETDIDNFGVDRAAVLAWNGNVIGAVAANDKVVIPVTLDTSRAFKFVVCYQIAATYDVTSHNARINDAEVTFTQSSASEYILTLASAATATAITFGTAAATLEFSAPAPMGMQGREMHTRSAFGKAIQQSFADPERSLDIVTIEYNPMLSIPTGGLATLHQWRKDQVYLKLENTSGATSPLLPVSGTIGAMSQLDTRTQNEVETITFIVDAEEV